MGWSTSWFSFLLSLHVKSDLCVISDVMGLAHLKEHGVLDDREVGVVHSRGEDSETRGALDCQLTTGRVHGRSTDVA